MSARPLSLRVTKAVVRTLGALPPALQARIAGPRAVIDGRRLHPEVAMVLRLLNATAGPDFVDLPLAQARAQIDAEAWAFAARIPVGRVSEVVIDRPDSSGGPLRARRYDPEPARAGAGIVVYFHGGGWVLGGLDSADTVCRFLTRHAGVSVLSVDYRLAPEHPFPAATHDALAAYRYAVAVAPSWGVDPRRVVLAGDSAGGNLATVTALAIRDAHRRGDLAQLPAPAAQLLFFPVTDLSRESGSYATFAEGYFLTRRQMHWYTAHYLGPDGDPSDPRVSPLLASDLSGVAPVYLGVSGFDVLREEGIAYAARLREAGVAVTLDVEDGHIHAYVNATGVGRTGRLALGRAAAYLRQVLDPAGPESPR